MACTDDTSTIDLTITDGVLTADLADPIAAPVVMADGLTLTGDGIHFGDDTYSVELERTTDETVIFSGAVTGEMVSIATTSTDGETCLGIMWISGSTPTLQRVLVGPADSGGTGYRALVITN